MASWLKSKRLSTLFLYCSWAVVALGVAMAFMLTPWFPRLQNSASGELALLELGAPLAVVAGPASMVLILGMAIFCVREGRSSVWEKVIWFFIFFLTAPFGSALYFFTVYRKLLKIENHGPISEQVAR
jgi:hypothetical protein